MTLSDRDGSITVVRLDGRLDIGGADRIGVPFTAATAGAGSASIVDLSKVTFIASMGIRLLISAARAVDRKGGKMVLFGATGPVKEVLEDTALDQLIPIVDSEEEALAEFVR